MLCKKYLDLRAASAAIFALAALAATPAVAQVTGLNETTTEAPLPDGVTISGYVETHYTYDMGDPHLGASNERIIVQRGFDNRHNTFQLDNVVVDGQFQRGPVQSKLAIQFGATPSSYYAVERTNAGTSGVAGTGTELWKYLQQGWIGLRLDNAGTWSTQAGLFLSPLGPESLIIKDSWNWSRSNLFFVLPAYHAGLRLNWVPAEHWTLSAMAVNGWNSAIDGNAGKSVALQAGYAAEKVQGSVLVMTGQERGEGAPEGKPWRHLADAWAQVAVHERVSLMAHVNAGMEANDIGTQTWLAGALYARVKLLERWWFAARGDVFTEQVPSNAAGTTAAAIFFPVSRVQSATGTVEWRPTDNLSLRAEVRQDGANGDVYVKGHVDLVPGGIDPLANARQRTTATLGLTAWF